MSPEDKFQHTDVQYRAWKSGESAAVSRQLNGESGLTRMWFDIKDFSERILDKLYFFFLFLSVCAYMEPEPSRSEER